MYNLCFLCVLFFGIVTGYPASNGYFIPQRSVIFGGYYSNPLFDYTRDLMPQGSAFVNQDIPAVELDQDENGDSNKETVEEEVSQSGADDEITTPRTILTETPGKKVLKKKQKPVQFENGNEKEEPRRTNGGDVFFPISFGGYRGSPKSRSGSEDELLFPSSAVAIANSYSTGKGGVATSHATSFGDPFLSSAIMRNKFFNHRSNTAA